MRYAIINAEKETIEYVELDNIDKAKELAGLDPMGVDHGTITHGLGIVVYEFGLLEPAEHYFTFNGQLYAGNAVLYAYDEHGETVDVKGTNELYLELKPPKFWHGVPAVEAALEAGQATRPYTAVNGEILQLWRNGALESL
jgi:hypothetical protein